MNKCIAATLLAAACWTQPAAAQTPPAKPAAPECSLDGEAAQMITACTKAIDSRKLGGAALAKAYAARATAYGYMQPPDQKRALADFDAAVRANPKDADVLGMRASWRIVAGDVPGAVTDFSNAMRIEPSAWLYSGRASAYMAADDYKRAYADIDYAIQFDSGNADHYYNRGLIENGLGKHFDAVRSFETALQKKPGYVAASCMRGLSYFLDADFNDAVKDLGTCPKDEVYPYMRILRYLAQVRGGGDSGGARRELDERGIMGREWPGPVRGLLLGRVKPEALLAAAADPDAAKAKRQDCEARYYIAQYHLVRGETAPAKQRLGEARDLCPKSFTEYFGALADLKRMDKK